MEPPHNELASRRVLIGTAHGMIEGDLTVAPQLRTLDFLNRTSTRFVSLQAARTLNARTSIHGDAVHLNIATILWVSEIGAMRRPGNAGGKPQLSRIAVRFCFADGEVLGFLHAPAQNDPFARLNQDRGLFLAVTSASITGPDTEMAAPFLAINSTHVLMIEPITHDDPIEDAPSVFEETRS